MKNRDILVKVSNLPDNTNQALSNKSDKTHTHNYAGSSSVGGAANSAAKLSTARTISLTGDVTGSTTFNGSANKSITATVNTPTSGNYFKGFPKIGADGVMEVGKYIDFHLTDTGTTDNDGRLTLGAANVLSFNGNIGADKNLIAGEKVVMYNSTSACDVLNPVKDSGSRSEVLKIGSVSWDYLNSYSKKGHRFVIGNTVDTAYALEVATGTNSDTGLDEIALRPYTLATEYDCNFSLGKKDLPFNFTYSNSIFTNYIYNGNDGTSLSLICNKAADSSGNNELEFRVSSSKYYFNPAVNDVVRLGSNSYKWANIWCTQSSLNTSSDRRLKSDIKYFNEDDRYEKMFMELKPCTFIKEGSEFGRHHTGLIAQELEESMDKYNIDYTDFGALLKVPVDKDGEELNVNDEEQMKNCVDYQYGIRYGELIPLNMHMIQQQAKKNESLEEQVKNQADEIQFLKDQINEIKELLK